MDATGQSKGDEAREEMLSRHRQEMRELRGKEMALKKAAAKGSKAEQKAKKKQVEDEISHSISQLEEKHTKELSSLGFIDKNNSKSNLDSIVMAIAGASITIEKDPPTKQSKGARRRERIAQEEAAREQRIQQEQNTIISDRTIENDRLDKKLEPLGLTINDIKPDGHCLYRAVENQLSLNSKNTLNYTYQELREMAAKYMRGHSIDFLPFFLSETKVEGEGDCSSPLERFERYCDEVESSSAWGGQLELGALTHCLKKHVIVLSGSFPDVEMGKEYKSGNGSIMLSYHKHAYGLGEHYNSVVPMG